ncbi:MAG: hypothetical protein AB7K68_03655 [Bacteriovoracia bacterium]
MTPIMVEFAEPDSSSLKKPSASSTKSKLGGGRESSIASDFSWLKSKGPLGQPGAGKNFQSGEDRGSVAFDAASDRHISDYSRLRAKIDGSLYYPTWMKASRVEGEVRVAIVFSRPPDGKFQIQVRSESSYLRVEVVRLFRRLLTEDLAPLLRGLQERPVFLHFLFSAEKPVEITIARRVHNNRLYFRRGFDNRPWIAQLKQNTKTDEKRVELDMFGFMNKLSRAKDNSLEEEDYKMDPAYRDTEPNLEGEIPT